MVDPETVRDGRGTSFPVLGSRLPSRGGGFRGGPGGPLILRNHIFLYPSKPQPPRLRTSTMPYANFDCLSWRRGPRRAPGGLLEGLAQALVRPPPGLKQSWADLRGESQINPAPGFAADFRPSMATAGLGSPGNGSGSKSGAYYVEKSAPKNDFKARS